jgi:MFS family permease
VSTLAYTAIPAKNRNLIISASLLALFLGALDALVMSAAMPTIVADLGGLHLYSWVYSAYLLARTVSLPIFGKLADIYRTKPLYVVSILIFIVASLAAGFAKSMLFLIICRAIQGIAAGGNFALVYIVLADISPPEERGKTLSLASFFINVPLGVLSLAGVSLYLLETREKKKKAIIDYSGALTLSISVLGLLFIFLLAGRNHAWNSPRILMLWAVTIVFGVLFYTAERRAREPIIPISFFRLRGFSVGNAAVFLSSFTIFSFFGFAPLFIQGALGKSPVEVWMVHRLPGSGPFGSSLGEKEFRCSGRLFPGYGLRHHSHIFDGHLYDHLFLGFRTDRGRHGICVSGNGPRGAEQCRTVGFRRGHLLPSVF